MRSRETDEQLDHEAGSPCGGPSGGITAVEGKWLTELGEDEGQYHDDFFEYLNELFCGFNGS